MTDDFKRQHQRRKPPHGAKEMLQISCPTSLETLELVIDEGADGATERHNRRGGWGFESWNNAEQVGDQNKEAKSHQEWRKPLAVVTDHVATLAFDEPADAFEHVLQSARTFDREARAHHDEDNQQETDYQQFHGDRIGNWRL